jgi:methyl-branched lipid omega-hydroxylase
MSTVGMHDQIDLSDTEFWQRPLDERMAAFARLRALDHPAFFAEMDIPFIKSGNGYYALVSHADVSEASRNAEVFSSEPCSNSVPDMPGWMARYFGSMINMDDPRHAKIRRVVSRAFTPKMLSKMEDDLQLAATQIVDDLIERGPCDFVTEVAAVLPVRVICDMMGIPERHHAMVLHATNIILGNADAEYSGIKPEPGRINALRGFGRLLAAGRRLHRLAMKLGHERRKNPTDDLISSLINAGVDGERLTPQELGSFFILLVVAGSETTRNAISHGLKLFTDHPEQRALLLGDFEKHIPATVNEIVRYTTPVIQFRRTLTRDHEMNGHEYKAGDKVLLFYNAANRDERVFTDPETFDITRAPNPRVSFGGPGPHYCLGAHLAKREITVMFRELFGRLPDIHSVGEPDRLLSNFINGVKHMRCDW